MSEWIKVTSTEDLPKNNQRVFVARNGEVKIATFGIYWIDEKGYTRPLDFYDHWMTFPEFPKIEDEETE